MWGEEAVPSFWEWTDWGRERREDWGEEERAEEEESSASEAREGRSRIEGTGFRCACSG